MIIPPTILQSSSSRAKHLQKALDDGLLIFCDNQYLQNIEYDLWLNFIELCFDANIIFEIYNVRTQFSNDYLQFWVFKSKEDVDLFKILFSGPAAISDPEQIIEAFNIYSVD